MVRTAESATPTWQAWFDRAIELADPVRTPELLAEMTVADNVDLRPIRHRRPPGMPLGQPRAATLRAASDRLLRLADTEPDPARRQVWTVLGLYRAIAYPKRGPDGADDELIADLDNLRSAVTAAAGNPVLESIASSQLAFRSRDLFDFDGALHAAQACRTAARRLREHPQPTSFLHQQLPRALWLNEPVVMADLFEFRGYMRAAVAARFLRDYRLAAQMRDAQVEVARRLVSHRPSRLADALGQRASLALVLGDIETAMACLDEQGRLVEESADTSARLIRYRSRANYAKFLHDWDDERAQRLQRLSEQLAYAGHTVTDPDPATVLALVPALLAREERPTLTTVGNCAHDLARSLVFSGRTTLDASARAEALDWLHVAEESWADFAMNGQIAIDFRRLEIEASAGTAGPVLRVGRRMVQLSRDWRRPSGQRKAAISAALYGEPADAAVLDRLMELRADAPPVDAAYLDIGLGQWHLRAGDRYRTEGGTEAPVQAWREAARRAEDGARGLSIDRDDQAPLLLNPEQYVSAVRLHADALRRLRQAGVDDHCSAADEIVVRLQAMPGIARMLSAASTPEQRVVIARTHFDWLAETARLAAREGDSNAADAVTEVVRRDVIGSMLTGMRDDPDMPERIRQLARQLMASLGAVVVETDTDPSDPTRSDATATIPVQPDDGGGASPDQIGGSGFRATTLDTQFLKMLDVVGSVISPVAKSMIHPDEVLAVTAQDVLEEHRRSPGPAAVLSLWLFSDQAGSQLLRRLAWRETHDGPPQHWVDVVAAPPWLPDLRPRTLGPDDAYFTCLELLRDVVLPPPLQELLRRSTEQDPVDLTIIPTGLFHIAFSAIPVDDERFMLHCAVITEMQSLQSARAIAQRPRPKEETATSVATFDTKGLAHSEEELLSLRKHHSPLFEANSLAEMDRSFRSVTARGTPGLFALAVHGVPGTTGWSQRKLLPSGEKLSTGHVLQWHLPQLVVAASCSTSIERDVGEDLGGFPLAFHLRGATAVIGTLHFIEDESTAQIMQFLYEQLANGSDPARALRQSQLRWIAEDPDSRLREPYRWCYLLTYGQPS